MYFISDCVCTNHIVASDFLSLYKKNNEFMKVLFLVCLTAIVKKFVSITFHFSPVLPNEVEARFHSVQLHE